MKATSFLLLLLTGLPTVLGLTTAAVAAPPKQGEALLKTDIMAVFAHPDDETGAAATLAAYALGKDKVVANVYCTRGEGGGNNVGTQWGAALGILRETELKDCLSLIGVRYCYFLDQQDFFYTESLEATFQKWGKEQTLERLVRLIRALRPEIMITMNPAPTPGQHGHHQAAGVLATEAFDAAADPSRFPAQLTAEGLNLWQPRKLYYGGGEPGHAAAIDVDERLANGNTPARIAAQAAANHRSQGFGGFANSPQIRRPRFFTLVKSVVPFTESETDLFRGLPIDDAQPKRTQPAAIAKSEATLNIAFVPRPAIARYRQWATAQNIGHVSAKMLADMPVIAGKPNELQIQIQNPGKDTCNGELHLQTAEAWQLEPSVLKYQIAPGATQTLQFRLTPPTSAKVDVELTATTEAGGMDVKAVAKAHPVPFTAIGRLKAPPAMDGSDNGWADSRAIEIPATNIAEGKVKDAADSSARFRLAHDGTTLFVDVEVNDDVIVSNIAPNDIRGHWRSDSIEICIDPDGGSEHTLGCFKVGIFPFDTTGVVRAARDADAHQGPIEQTAPSMRIVSRRTPAGYRIQVAIPFAELKFQPTAGKQVGFNLIVYDGDKPNAAIGENINKSRIAWSPRPGVQGRPEDWGRVVFE